MAKRASPTMGKAGRRKCGPDCRCRIAEAVTVGWGRVKWLPREDGVNVLYVLTGLEFEPVAHFADDADAKHGCDVLRRAFEDAILCERQIGQRSGPPRKTNPER